MCLSTEMRAWFAGVDSSCSQVRFRPLAEIGGFLEKEISTKYPKRGGLRAQYVLAMSWIVSESRGIISTDVGQHQMWAAQFCKSSRERQWLSSGGAGTMGYGFPAAIGAQLGCPNDLVVTVVGDGGFQMTLAELSTAALREYRSKF